VDLALPELKKLPALELEYRISLTTHSLFILHPSSFDNVGLGAALRFDY
jgi:hypothetical protein